MTPSSMCILTVVILKQFLGGWNQTCGGDTSTLQKVQVKLVGDSLYDIGRYVCSGMLTSVDHSQGVQNNAPYVW